MIPFDYKKITFIQKYFLKALFFVENLNFVIFHPIQLRIEGFV